MYVNKVMVAISADGVPITNEHYCYTVLIYDIPNTSKQQTESRTSDDTLKNVDT